MILCRLLGSELCVRERRVAQLVICPVAQAALVEVAVIDDDTARCAGGFGSTGS